MERQQRENQRVEHCSLIYTVTVTLSGHNARATINGEPHKVYPTGSNNEPWTTNISLARFSQTGESRVLKRQ